MADGKLKILDMYTKVVELSRQLAQDPSGRGFIDMEFLRLSQMITAMNAGADRLYGNSANGLNFPETSQGVTELRRQMDDLYLNLHAFKDRYMSETTAPDGPTAKLLRQLESDVLEDRSTLGELDYQPGMSLMEAVYGAQKKRELGQAQEQELPGYEEVHGIDYPGFDTLHGQQREAPPEAEPGSMDYPGMNTLRMHEGGAGPALRPYERVYGGTDTFYQDQMDLPSGEEVARQNLQYQRQTRKSLQIWTVAPLTNAIIEETAKTYPAASQDMMAVNQNLSDLFQTVYPFNPKTGEEPRIPNEQDIADIKAKTAQAYNQLQQWKDAYTRTCPDPSAQVLYMTDNVMKKLEDDYLVLNNVNVGRETLPEAALRSSRLPKHFGLEDDRKTPLRSPEPTVSQTQAQAQSQAQAQPQVQTQPQPGGPQEGAAPEEEKVPAPEELYKAFYELQGIQDAIAKADPKWMLSSSEAYGKMRKGIEGTIKFVLKNRQTFSSTPDPDSPEYKKAAKEFMRRLRVSKGQASAYLDKKAGELEKDSGRKEDADRQKWEQQRIRAALNSFEKLNKLTGGEQDAAVDAKAALYRQTLLSEKSRAILAEETAERPPEAAGPVR